MSHSLSPLLTPIMDQSLRDAAQQGSVDALYALIQRDSKVLDRIDEIPFVDTPLHDAAYAGHTRFAMEIVRLKPSFLRKLNQNGFTPVHLVLQNDQTQLLHRLLDVDEGLVRVQGKEGVTPLHYVAQTGNLHLLAKFQKFCPMSIKDVTIRGETALHIALNNNQLDAFHLLIRWLQQITYADASSLWEKKLLNWKDEGGKTILHIAIMKNLPQVVRWLLDAKVLDTNATNLADFTALDILAEWQTRIDDNNDEIWGPRNIDIAVDLREAAQQGSVDSLYTLIKRDANILNRIDEIPFVETPLHIAVFAEHIPFVMEIMRLKPSFARKLNQDGFTPLHFALQYNKTPRVAQLLLDVDEELVRVQGKEGLTPLHYVAKTGNLHLLAEFLKACPKSIEDITVRSETVLHIALKYNMFDAFRLQLGWLRRAWFRNASLWEKKLLNWQDEEGNTVLHIAVFKNQPEIVRLLVNFGSFLHHTVDINVKNSEGQRAFEMEHGDMLHCARRTSISLLSRVEYSLEDYLQSPVKFDEKIYILFLRQRTKITDNTRNILLVVAALLVAITFQTTVNPPGGVWQDTYLPTSNTSNSIAPTTDSYEDSSLGPPPHYAGQSTMSLIAFIVLSILNLISFCSTILTIFVLLPVGGLGIFNVSLYILSLCFIFSLWVTAPVAIIVDYTTIYYFLLSPLLIFCLERIMKRRRRKLVQSFLPKKKVLDPTLT